MRANVTEQRSVKERHVSIEPAYQGSFDDLRHLCPALQMPSIVVLPALDVTASKATGRLQAGQASPSFRPSFSSPAVITSGSFASLIECLDFAALRLDGKKPDCASIRRKTAAPRSKMPTEAVEVPASSVQRLHMSTTN